MSSNIIHDNIFFETKCIFKTPCFYKNASRYPFIVYKYLILFNPYLILITIAPVPGILYIFFP